MAKKGQNWAYCNEPAVDHSIDPSRFNQCVLYSNSPRGKDEFDEAQEAAESGESFLYRMIDSYTID
jgi:hypothetical protein